MSRPGEAGRPGKNGLPGQPGREGAPGSTGPKGICDPAECYTTAERACRNAIPQPARNYKV